MSKLRGILREGIEQVQPRARCAWKLITFTSVYDPTCEADLTVEGLRERIRGLWRAVRGVMRTHLAVEGGGAFASMELAGSGNVHVHMLAFTHAYVAKEALEAELREHWERAGFVDIDDLGATPGRAVKEVAKYCAKSAGPLSEDWLEGKPREVMDPVLCARWEVAALSLRMAERWGVFRGVEVPEPDPADGPIEGFDWAVECMECGTSGEWHWSPRGTRGWARECHRKGFPAFAGSQWWIPDEQWHGQLKRE